MAFIEFDHHYRRPLKNLLLMRFFIRCWTEGAADFFFFLKVTGGPGSPVEINPGSIPEIQKYSSFMCSTFMTMMKSDECSF